MEYFNNILLFIMHDKKLLILILILILIIIIILLLLQEKLIQKYKIFCQYYENKGYLPPDFPQYCAVLIQKHFKRYLCQAYYKKLKELVNTLLSIIILYFNI